MSDDVPEPKIIGGPRLLRQGKLEPDPRDFWYGIATLITGTGLGWFLGLALETLGSTVFGPILTLISGSALVLAGVGVATERTDGATRANPIMIMLLVIGLVAGSVTSGRLRANLRLGPNPTVIASKTKMTDKEVSQRVFDKLYPPNVTTTSVDLDVTSTDTTSTTGPKVAEPLKGMPCAWLSLPDAALLEKVKSIPAMKGKSAEFVRKTVKSTCTN
jgi:hypothetical protein